MALRVTAQLGAPTHAAGVAAAHDADTGSAQPAAAEHCRMAATAAERLRCMPQTGATWKPSASPCSAALYTATPGCATLSSGPVRGVHVYAERQPLLVPSTVDCGGQTKGHAPP